MSPLFLAFCVWALWAGSVSVVASPPVIVLNQPSVSPSSALSHNLTATGDSLPFEVPGTKIELRFSKFHGLLNQGELDLCVIEGLNALFGKVLRKGSDGDLPLNIWSSQYGNVVINVDDFAPPKFRMTYGSVVTMMRGIALFASQYGYHQMDFEVFEFGNGHIGTGNLGNFRPG